MLPFPMLQFIAYFYWQIIEPQKLRTNKLGGTVLALLKTRLLREKWVTNQEHEQKRIPAVAPAVVIHLSCPCRIPFPFDPVWWVLNLLPTLQVLWIIYSRGANIWSEPPGNCRAETCRRCWYLKTFNWYATPSQSVGAKLSPRPVFSSAIEATNLFFFSHFKFARCVESIVYKCMFCFSFWASQHIQ
jgi:hypothetical protein